MKMNLPRSLPAGLALCWILAVAIPPAQGEISEPDNVVWGVITLGGQPVTAAHTNVLVEARKTPGGPVVASYRLGAAPAYGDAYSLRIPLEAFLPLTDANASRIGGLIYLTVRDETGVRVARTASIPGRGTVTRLDVIEPDSDGDGLPDAWEQRYFGSGTGADPGADPDRDGRNNRDEQLAGTDPTRADGRHPADAAPANNAISLEEFTAYADAWYYGDPWTTSPTNIPHAYVTRAAFLWLAGETYVFTNAVPNTNAPLWWASPAFPSGASARSNAVHATLPPTIDAGEVLTVSLRVTPSEQIFVHAIEDGLPAGWTVVSISHGGNHDVTGRKVKWGPFFDAGEREISYTARPPAGASGLYSFVVEASFDGHDLAAPIRRSVQVGGAAAQTLRFTASGSAPAGPRFTLQGNPTTSYQLEFSTDLTTWSLLSTITTDASGQFILAPENPGQFAQRFYRARTP